MVEILIGTGGWNYFNVPGDRLRNYARVFKTVEVNSTYYSIPELSMVEGWRRRVPSDFEFTVRCNRELIRRLQLESLNQSFEVFECMKQICSILRANILHIQISSIFKLDSKMISKIDDFLSSISNYNPQLAWQINANDFKSERHTLLGILEKHKAIHCIDLSKENPAYQSNIIYSRLFGKGLHNVYQFTNSELEEIDGKVREGGAEKVYLNFHGVKMYKDAARINIYETSGKFPKVTRGEGIPSVLEVLKEDAQFPSTTSMLIKSQGWKVYEWKDFKQLHVSEILNRIGEKSFGNLSDLEVELRRLKF